MKWNLPEAILIAIPRIITLTNLVGCDCQLKSTEE